MIASLKMLLAPCRSAILLSIAVFYLLLLCGCASAEGDSKPWNRPADWEYGPQQMQRHL
jgi:hypothetical protein